ncbi:putative repeat protein (TIGR02543 family) [Desulfobotulus alkaliphilus]|uniref:Putative repeat protein (TIGR02543 family) n=1 Tax=Desulfobotulus alkaliphilus TaxID=622671 RepID=A0A562R0R6_9BACT|nr:InlB B-repeat-containing protein [Desulfobotulus alkaliphilus]TWI62665.1 putative repeat protein (TIGR02543 family) [Desulfobotulus alkaliphilus]
MKKAFVLVFTVLALLTLGTTVLAQTATAPTAGDGSSGDPYQIASLENLYWIAAPDTTVPNPNRAARWAAYYIQTADINASATSGWGGGGWTPIGNTTTFFIGTYDGGGHTISGLFINRAAEEYQGLFGATTGSATIENLGLMDVNITGYNYVGGLVGCSFSSSSVTNSYVTGKVSGSYYVGGLVGSNSGTVNNSYATGAVTGTEMYVGGLVGLNSSGYVTNSYATGAVSGNDRVGGLVGYNYTGSVTNSYATGQVTGTGGQVGGLVGFNFYIVTNSFFDRETTGQSDTGKGTPKTTLEMKTQSTFTDAGWDFTTIWIMDDPVNSGYPFLRGVTPAYTVIYNGNNATGGSAPVDNRSPYPADATVTVLGAGDLVKTGHAFNGWNTQTGGGGDARAEGGTFTSTASVVLYAQWTASTYTVTFDRQNGTDGSASVTATYDQPMPTATAPVRAGYTFGGYYTEINGGGTQYYTAAMASAQNWDLTANTTLYAKWTLNSYTVTGTAGTGGSIDPASQTVTHGQTTTFTVTPDTGYAIASVTGCDGTLSGSTYTTGTVTGACTVSATFSLNTYTVAGTAGTGGSISPASRTVNHGATTTFTVTPNTGYAISSVSGCGGSLSGSTYTTGAVTGACTVSATFSLNTYTVTGTAGTGGGIDPASQTVTHGQTTTFTVTPDTGYAIASVSGCGGSLSGSTYTTGAVTGACTVSATFSLNTYTVAGTAGTGGGIDPASQTVTHGQTTTFTVTPNTGYAIASVSGCGGSLSGNTYTTGAVTEACTVSATFSLNTYTVTYNANSATSGTAPDTQTKTHGQNLTLATNSGNLARTGYTFAGWNTAADGSGTDYGEGATYTENAPLSLYVRWMHPPAVTTQAATNIGMIKATGHGNITDLGNPNPTAHGLCWATTANPTTAGTCINRGAANATLAFTVSITGLSPGTTYHVRAFATNAAGIVYGENKSFTTANPPPVTYPVIYMANGADSGVVPAGESKVHDQSLALSYNTGNLVRAGYTFAGWNTAGDGSGTNYGEGTIYTLNAALTLYARWTQNT